MRVAALYAYPVKSCGAVALAEAALGPLGLEHDRRFAFVDADGRALTQRSEPLLATVRPALGAQALHLDFGGLAELAIPLRAFAESTTVDVWGKRIPGSAAPEELLAGAAEYLGAPVRLVALERSAQRAFADAEPVLVTTSAMLASLNAELAQAVGMERFRPNLVLDGADADWQSLHAGSAALERVKPCSRCEVTTIDQASGERRGDAPLRTLNQRFAGNFGVYCRVSRAGRIARGDAVRPVPGPR